MFALLFIVLIICVMLYIICNKKNNIYGGNLHKNLHLGNLQSPHFENIRDGSKKLMNVNDIWEFTHPNGIIRIKITNILIFKSFEDAINSIGYKNLLPNAKSNEDAINIYNAFDNGNYEKNAKIYGVVCFAIELI